MHYAVLSFSCVSLREPPGVERNLGVSGGEDKIHHMTINSTKELAFRQKTARREFDDFFAIFNLDGEEKKVP